MKTGRDEEQQLKVENEVDCGKDSLVGFQPRYPPGWSVPTQPNLAFDLVTRRGFSHKDC